MVRLTNELKVDTAENLVERENYWRKVFRASSVEGGCVSRREGAWGSRSQMTTV